MYPEGQHQVFSMLRYESCMLHASLCILQAACRVRGLALTLMVWLILVTSQVKSLE
jgi:hypothetical protein